MNRQRALRIGSGVAAVAIALGALWRGGYLASPPRPPNEEWMERAAPVYAAIRTVPTGSLGSVEAVREVLARAAVSGEAPPGTREKLVDEAAAFVFHRFCQPSAGAYRAWREASGCVLKSMEEMTSPRYFVGEAHEAYFGAPVPAGTTVGELFERFWAASQEYGGGYNRVRAIAAEPGGLAVALGTITKADPFSRPALGGPMPEGYWHGASGATMRRWFTQPRDTEALVTRLGEVACAEVGMVVEAGDGSRRPVVLTYLWDPQAGAWSLEHVNVYNASVERLSPMEY